MIEVTEEDRNATFNVCGTGNRLDICHGELRETAAQLRAERREIERLKAELKRQLTDESHGQECQLRYEKTPGYGCTCKRSEGKPPGPKRYEMNYDRMTCFDAPSGEDSDAPEEATEWISAQDYEAEIAEKNAEIKALEIQLGKLIVPPHEFRPFGKKKIWCDICGQREGSEKHLRKVKK